MASWPNKTPLYGKLHLPNARYVHFMPYAKRLKNKGIAAIAADICESMTGDETRLVRAGNSTWYIERWTGSKWVRG